MIEVEIDDLLSASFAGFLKYVHQDKKGDEPVFMCLAGKEFPDVFLRKPLIFLCHGTLFWDDDPKKDVSLAVLAFACLEKAGENCRFFGIGESLEV